MANEINYTVALACNKAGVTSGSVGRGAQALIASMGGSIIQQDQVLANHLGNGAISSASNAFPVVITTTLAHGLTSGETVVITGVATNTNANGTWQITVLTATTFSIPTVGNGAGTGGTWRTDPLQIATKLIQPHFAWFENLDSTNYIKVLSGNGNIGSISNAPNSGSPTTITTALAHGIPSGGTPTVVIAGVLGNTAVNGTFTATYVSATTFTIPIAGNGTYTTGGYYFIEPVTTIAKLQAGEAALVPIDDLATLYTAAPVAAAQLEYLVLSL